MATKHPEANPPPEVDEEEEEEDARGHKDAAPPLEQKNGKTKGNKMDALSRCFTILSRDEK